LLNTRSVFAARVALERDATTRLRRLRDAAGDAARQRVRPTRPRMRALVAAPGARLHWRPVPAPPPPGPLEAVVHPIAVATCDMDKPLVLGATPFLLPLRLGHECIAEVVSVGEDVTTVSPGQRVVVPFQISCGACLPCLHGYTSNCISVPPISMYGFGVGGGHWGGALSDELVVPYADAMLVPLPDGVDPVKAASVADNVCDAYRHIAPYLPEILTRDPGGEVLIVACVQRRPVFSHSVPLYAGLVAQALGARNVVLADTRATVRDQAQRLGLDVIHPRELRRRQPAPLVVDISGHPRGLWLSLIHTAADGVCSSAGGLHSFARIPTGLMYGRNMTFHVGRTDARTLIPQVLGLISDGRLHPEVVTTAVAPMDEAPSALRDHVMSDSAKTILVA
jgi:alcohol dehydrogenase